MGQQQPEAKDGLGKDIQDGVSNDLAVHIHLASAIGDTPDTTIGQLLTNLNYDDVAADDGDTHMGYRVQRSSVKSEMAPKNAFVLLSLLVTAYRPLYPTWYTMLRYARHAKAYQPQLWPSRCESAAKSPVRIMTTSENMITRMLAPLRPARSDRSRRRRGVVSVHCIHDCG